MRCPSCDHENSSERRFCGECGVALAAMCAACGASNGPSEKFCAALVRFEELRAASITT